MTTPNTITILGGGIMGLTCAYMLADAHNVTIHDPKGFPADNASKLAGGMLAPWSEIEHMDETWVKAGLHAIDFWENLPLDTGFQKDGSLLIACPEDRYILERFKTHLPHDLQTYQNVQALENQLPYTFQNGVFLKDEAHLNPIKTMNALITALKNKVQFSSAAPHSNTDLTIDCCGMGSDDPDLRGVKGETLLVRNTEFALSRPVRLMHPRYPLYIIPRDNHTFMIGATVIESAPDTEEDESTSLKSAMELMSAAYALHPSFGEADILDIKAGIRPSYPDNLPRITINKNRISCNGLFRHGYLLSPVMAQCVADHLAGRDNQFTSLFIKDTHDENHNQRAA